MKKQILKFKKDNLKSVNFFTKGIQFPVAIAAYSEWEEQQISYMCKNYNELKMNTEDICKWCITHGITYQMMYPLCMTDIVKYPIKFYKYVNMRQRLWKEKIKVSKTKQENNENVI